MSGIAGYSVALTRTSVIVTAAPAQFTVEKSPGQLTPSASTIVSEDSAVIEAVKKTEPGVVTIINTLQSGLRA